MTDTTTLTPPADRITLWAARIVIGLVFIINLQCCFSFIVFPESFVGAYELSGVSGVVALQGIAVAFLMWNATYPFAIAHPVKNRVVYLIVLIQQAIGLIGETLIYFSIGEGHAVLHESILRFILFDGAGLILMVIPFVILSKGRRTNR